MTAILILQIDQQEFGHSEAWQTIGVLKGAVLSVLYVLSRI